MLPLISQTELKQARKILYMSHLAIGDFVYQGYFLKTLAARYPQLQLDVWIEDFRSSPKSWHNGRNQMLCQWLGDEPFIHTIYPIATEQESREDIAARIRQQDYDLVVFMTSSRKAKFAHYAKRVAPNAKIVGLVEDGFGWGLPSIRARMVTDASYAFKSSATTHISQLYADRFNHCFDLQQDCNNRVALAPTVPTAYQEQAKAQLNALKAQHQLDTARVIFINPLSTSPKRDLSSTKLIALMAQLHQAHANLLFVISLPPDKLDEIEHSLAASSALESVHWHVFTASQHFMQLPAMLSMADVVITVETAIMHLASSLDVFHVVVMRDKARCWQPLRADAILFTQGNVDTIPTNHIEQAVSGYLEACHTA